MDIVFLTTKIFKNKKSFCEQWCRSDKLTNDKKTKWIVQRNKKKVFFKWTKKDFTELTKWIVNERWTMKKNERVHLYYKSFNLIINLSIFVYVFWYLFSLYQSIISIYVSTYLCMNIWISLPIYLCIYIYV